MSQDHQSTAEAKSRPGRRAAMAAAALTLGMGAVSLATVPAAQAAPAAASTQAGIVHATAVQASAGPCTVKALKPYFSGRFTLSGKKIVIYPIRVTCTRGNVNVHLQQKLMEADTGPDETQRNWFTPSGSPLHFSTPGTKTIYTEYRLSNLDWIGAEEVYHNVKFRVSSNGVFSTWHGVESPELSISA
jgi:hypothetical protein